MDVTGTGESPEKIAPNEESAVVSIKNQFVV